MTLRTHVAREADRPPTEVMPRKQYAVPMMKPRGFWYEVDGDWRRWCESEQPDWIEGLPVFRVELGDEQILQIRTPEALLAFQDEYREDGHHEMIRWADVAERYDGIEIAPYQWEHRLGMLWYYGWDCASGCIWQPRGVRLTQVEPKPGA